MRAYFRLDKEWVEAEFNTEPTAVFGTVEYDGDILYRSVVLGVYERGELVSTYAIIDHRKEGWWTDD
ncbi:MAG: hypothetical protein ACXAB9_15335 [Candidatus Thorarchaeota archaeon]|jgi:hypothetical protein